MSVNAKTSEPPIARPLGKMERSVWFCDQSSPANVGFGCEITGRVTDDGLRGALRWCQIRHPILRSVIVPKDRSLYLGCYEMAEAPAISLEIREGSPEDEDDFVMEEMRKRLDDRHGLLVRAKLLRLGEDRAFLTIVFSHVIGDGYSGILLLQDLLNYLGKLARDGAVPDPEPLPFPPPSEAGIAAEHRGWSGMKKLFALQGEIAGHLKRYGGKPSPIRVEANPPYASRKVRCASFSLDEAQTLALTARARREKVSVFALLSALLLEAAQPLLESTRKGDASPNRVVSLAAPVDMRSFLKNSVKGHFGFYSGAINQLCRVGETNDLPELARQLQADLKKSFFRQKVHLHTSPLLADFLAWRWLFPVNEKGAARIAKLTEGMFKAVATSITFLNEPLVIPKDFGIAVSRPRGHISPSIMGVAFYCLLLHQNTLAVDLNYNEGQLADEDARLLNERFRSRILAMGEAEEARPA